MLVETFFNVVYKRIKESLNYNPLGGDGWLFSLFYTPCITIISLIAIFIVLKIMEYMRLKIVIYGK